MNKTNNKTFLKCLSKKYQNQSGGDVRFMLGVSIKGKACFLTILQKKSVFNISRLIVSKT